jgi:dihydrolipoamide dehydrogenase
VYDSEVSEERTDAPATPAGKARETVTATHVLVATGSVARDLPFAKFGSDAKIWGAREAMYNRERPESLIVIGSGAIGMEFGYFYHSFGTKVTVVEMLDRILPVEDEEVSAAMLRLYKKQGFDFRLGQTAVGVDAKGKKVKVTIAPFKDGKADEGKKETLEADRLLLAIGVTGRFDGLFDEGLGLEVVKGHIKTDYKPGEYGDPKHYDYKTSVEGVHAVGDVIGPPWLAHVASDEAIVCVERIAWREGKEKHEPIPIDYSVIPGCTYCQPQVASVGFTEQALRSQGLKKGEDYEVGKFPLTALG